MAKKKKAKKSLLYLLRTSWFYRIYFGVLMLCAVALVIGLKLEGEMLKEYEQTRPVHSAEAVLNMLNQRDWSQLQAMDESAKKLRYAGADQYAQYMDELTYGSAFTLKNVLSIDENEQKYNVLMGEKKFAEMLFVQSDETTAHGFKNWKLESIATTVLDADQYTITVPSDFTVQINGTTLSDEDILESGISMGIESNLPEGVTAPVLTRYGVNTAFGKIENLSITDGKGNSCEPVQDGENSWSCGLAYDESVRAKCEDGVITWGRRLAAYTTGDYDKFDLSGACVNPSPARTFIRNMENQWAAAHSGYDFENIKTFDCYVYSDTCLSCKISFDYIVHYKKEDKTYPTAYTLYFVKDGGKFKLYSFTMD